MNPTPEKSPIRDKQIDTIIRAFMPHLPTETCKLNFIGAMESLDGELETIKSLNNSAYLMLHKKLELEEKLDTFAKRAELAEREVVALKREHIPTSEIETPIYAEILLLQAKLSEAQKEIERLKNEKV